MLRKLVFLLSLITLIQLSHAQIVKIEMNPQTLLPNDVAYCKLIFTAQQNTYVTGISLLTPYAIEAKPSSISGVGLLTAGSSYEFPFTIKAKESGIFQITAIINTLNGSIKQTFVVRVLNANAMPEIILNKTTLTLNEVNEVAFTLYSPLSISNVVVEPLFNANPKLIYVHNGEGFFKFEPKEIKPLKFKIKFYNGKNYHEILRVVNVNYVESKGVFINASPKYTNILKGDVDPIDIQITNLRTDTIFSIDVKADELKSEDHCPIIEAKKSWTTTFLFSSKESGMKSIKLEVCYADELNNRYCEEKTVEVNVINETVLQFSGIEVKPGTEGLTLSGDVSNNGKSKIYNIMIYAITRNQTKTYYIDELDPSDFDTFEFTLQGANYVTLKAKWTNEIGETFENAKIINLRPYTHIIRERKAPIAYYLAFATLIIVSVAIISAWKRRR